MLVPLTSLSAFFPFNSVDPDFVLTGKNHKRTRGQKTPSDFCHTACDQEGSPSSGEDKTRQSGTPWSHEGLKVYQRGRARCPGAQGGAEGAEWRAEQVLHDLVLERQR